jgi:hypothetical protein
VDEETRLFDAFNAEVRKTLQNEEAVIDPAISQSILLMREAKDILEELTIILSVYTAQAGVLSTMHGIISQGDQCDRGSDARKQPQTRSFSPTAVVHHNIHKVRRLIKSAEDAVDAVSCPFFPLHIIP